MLTSVILPRRRVGRRCLASFRDPVFHRKGIDPPPCHQHNELLGWLHCARAGVLRSPWCKPRELTLEWTPGFLFSDVRARHCESVQGGGDEPGVLPDRGRSSMLRTIGLCSSVLPRKMISTVCMRRCARRLSTSTPRPRSSFCAPRLAQTVIDAPTRCASRVAAYRLIGGSGHMMGFPHAFAQDPRTVAFNECGRTDMPTDGYVCARPFTVENGRSQAEALLPVRG